MGKRFRGATFAAVAVAGIVTLGGCSSRSAAQRAYLIAQSSSLGRCSLGEEGDFGGPFRPLRATSWDDLGAAGGAWARLRAWQIASRPKDPPGDYTVTVEARFEFLRGNQGVLRPTVGAHERDAQRIAKAIDLGLDVYVGVEPIRRVGAYVSPALALDETGKVAWLGECAHRNSDSMAAALERAHVNPTRVGPAMRAWWERGDTDALLRALARK